MSAAGTVYAVICALFHRSLTFCRSYSIILYSNSQEDSAMMGPDPKKIIPNGNIPSLCFIKNVINWPNIIVGDYTYYDDPEGAEDFESHVTHLYEFLGD